MDDVAPPPQGAFPELRDWHSAGMHDAVFRATSASGDSVYVREDDGSAPLLRRLAREPEMPAPRVLDRRDGWLVLEELPGVPLHAARWRERPEEAVPIIADALLRLSRKAIRHGDMCLPNILGDPASSQLSGIVDWRYAGRFDQVIDVASAIWSCDFNGCSPEVPIAVLRAIGWPRADAMEVERLGRVWIALAGPPD